MSNFPPPDGQYDRRNETDFRTLVKQALDQCLRRNQDVEIGNGRLILKDTVTGSRYSVTMVSGVLTTTAL